MEDEPDHAPESLLPYDRWTAEALRHVMLRALQHAATEGLPGGHHFYITFRTDHPGVAIPKRLLAQYPHEMTIVLQHQFWDLTVDEAQASMSVGLTFGGVPATLRIPLAAITAFADPYAQHGMRFEPDAAAPPAADETAADETGADETGADEPAAGAPAAAPDQHSEPPQVVSLDAFRRRTPPKE
ncbi:MAG: hypothetical protein KGQ40_02850 [Rhodospirillales bacterium]|nr:hypothetical protein [Rhodospirillales bacterium]